MNVVEGDLIALALQGKFDVIVHGCNCFCSMQAGIAKSIQDAFPEAYLADCATASGERAKLGTFSSALVVRGDYQFTVVNAYTQFGYQGAGNADYEAIQQVFAAIAANFHGLRIGYPMIGAGLGGGNWAVIEAIIERALVGENHTLVRFQPAQFNCAVEG